MRQDGPSDLVCGVCAKPIRPGSPVLFRDGRMFHLPCFGRGTPLEALAPQDRATKGRAAATEPATRAARLVEDGPRVRQVRACATCGRLVRADDVASAPDGTPVHVACPASPAVATPPA
jgi:hypothetical protein